MKIRMFSVLLLCCASFSCQRVEQTAKEVEQVAQGDAAVINATQAELDAVKTPCDDAATIEEAESCLRAEFDKTDREMNQLYNKIIGDLQNFQAKAKSQDETLAEKYKNDYETLRQAQDFWVNYRKFNCKAERETPLNAANAAALGLSCFERMTEERIENLKFIYENK